MAYNEFIADRIRLAFKEEKSQFEEKKMMGGLCFMVDNKMCCGVHFDKKKQTDLIMARIGPEAYEAALTKKGVHPMDFTGRTMNGYIFIDPEGFDLDEDLQHWISLCLAFNPLAKASKKRKRKN